MLHPSLLQYPPSIPCMDPSLHQLGFGHLHLLQPIGARGLAMTALIHEDAGPQLGSPEEARRMPEISEPR